MDYSELTKIALCFAVPAAVVGLLYLLVRYLPLPAGALAENELAEVSEDQDAAGRLYPFVGVIVLSALGLAVLWN